MTDHRYSAPHDDDKDADTLVRRLGDSAQQVWLAGLGAFNRAQAEGSRVFDSLVTEGRDYEQRHKVAGQGSSGIRDNVEAGLGQARERGQHTWNKIEQAFDDQVQGVLKRLNVPCRADVTQLEQQLQALRTRLGDLEGQLARHQAKCNCGTGNTNAAAPSTGSTPSS